MNKMLMRYSLLGLFFVTTICSAKFPPKPEKCPTVAAIQAVGLVQVDRDKNGLWSAGVMSNLYGTKDKWSFVIGKINATDKSNAKAKALTAMTSLQPPIGPTEVRQYNVWQCSYKNAAGYPAIAVTPAVGMLDITRL